MEIYSCLVNDINEVTTFTDKQMFFKLNYLFD